MVMLTLPYLTYLLIYLLTYLLTYLPECRKQTKKTGGPLETRGERLEARGSMIVARRSEALVRQDGRTAGRQDGVM